MLLLPVRALPGPVTYGGVGAPWLLERKRTSLNFNKAATAALIDYYRLVVAVDFEKSIVWIKWIGTHKDYDKIDVKEVQHDG